jgi:DNA-binding CsgD family transcriptional regulator/PAS domain-containing protein
LTCIDAARLGNILGHIYDAALDFSKWGQALDAIREVLRANNVIVILRPGTAKAPGLSLVYREALYEYADPFSNAEFLGPYDGIAAGEVLTIADLFSDEQWQATPFYRKHCEPADVYDTMLLDLRLHDDSVYRIRITRPASAERFNREDKELLGLLAPHLKRAFEMQTMLERKELLHAQYVEVCDRMGVATFILDTKGNVLQHNKSACELLGGLDGLSITNGRLVAIDPGSNKQLLRLINEALDRCDSVGAPLISNVMPVVRPLGKPNLGLFVQSLPTAKLRSGRHRPAVTIFVRDPAFRTEAPVAVAQRLYKLTQAETALVLELANGLSLGEASKRLGVRQSTARAQLRSVFAKTGTQKQTSLMRMVLNSMVPPGDGDHLAMASAPGPAPGQGSQARMLVN